LEYFNSYLDLVNIPNSLKFRQKSDVEKIIEIIGAGRLRQKEE